MRSPRHVSPHHCLSDHREKRDQVGPTRPWPEGYRAMIVESPLDIIFRDLFYRLRGFAGGHDVFLKLEGFNITGSIKVKTAIGLVEDLERRGLATPSETV